ncbi:MAG TPA: hypothetical protein VEU07_13770, partial [Candidatus Acidoferrum sp.]|nr:hypothetical protein [Candidatus Acidoferrum sp.]
SALGCLLCPPARTAMVAEDSTLGGLTPARLWEAVSAAFPGGVGAGLRLALILVRGENPHEDLLPVRDMGETVETRIRRYHAFTERAYGIRPVPETVRVVRLLAVVEEGPSPIEIGPSLKATFARQQERGAPPASQGTASTPNGIPRVAVESLGVEEPAMGPALVVLPGASAFVPRGMPYHVDPWGNLILETGR